ncbi:MAG: TlpA family protein disulfide reductase [Dehalococcoidia bacterium]|nr:TlpA family protein disulfide reductase [Dehalococcoidia bacterium]
MSDRTWKVLRYIVLPLNTIALIVLVIWAIEGGRVPFIAGGGPGAAAPGGASASASTQFYALDGALIGAAKGSGPRIGEPAPEFTLQDINGKVVRLSDFRGRPVLINFWATWCPPCRKEFPQLVRSYDQGNGSFVVLGVDIRESLNDVRPFVKQYKATYPILMDDTGEVVRAYRLTGVPSSYFIDAQGILRDEYFGPLSGSKIDSRIAALRAGGSG